MCSVTLYYTLNEDNNMRNTLAARAAMRAAAARAGMEVVQTWTDKGANGVKLVAMWVNEKKGGYSAKGIAAALKELCEGGWQATTGGARATRGYLRVRVD